jgi:hypothetical protein
VVGAAVVGLVVVEGFRVVEVVDGAEVVEGLDVGGIVVA